MRTDVVIAAAWNYPVASYAAFIVSLRRSGFGGDIAIYGPTNNSAGVAELCRQWDASLVDAESAKLDGVTRFSLYARACRPYQRCLATDFRDVVYQSDPFALLPPPSRMPSLLLTLEPFKVGGCNLASNDELKSCFTHRFVLACFGQRALRAIAERTVINSGLIIGTPDGFDALKAVVALSARCPRGNGVGGHDQAALNELVHGGRYPANLSVILQPRGSGVANCLSIMTKTERGARAFVRDHMSADGTVVLNDDGTPSAVVHQYDRLVKSLGLESRAAADASRATAATRKSPMSPWAHTPSTTIRYRLRLRAIDEALEAAGLANASTVPSDLWMGDWGGRRLSSDL